MSGAADAIRRFFGGGDAEGRQSGDGRMDQDGAGWAITKTDAEWRDALSREEYQVLRKAATERAWTGALLDEKRAGVYTCKACGSDLFRSTAKFESGSGWPSFFEPIPDAVTLKRDSAFGMIRTEVVCATCGSHLGHLFDDAPQTPTGDRYCMNSISLSFEENR